MSIPEEMLVEPLKIINQKLQHTHKSIVGKKITFKFDHANLIFQNDKFETIENTSQKKMNASTENAHSKKHVIEDLELIIQKINTLKEVVELLYSLLPQWSSF